MEQRNGNPMLREIRMGFIGQGTSFAKWCADNGIKRQNARAAVLGEWTGPKARQVVQRLSAASSGEVGSYGNGKS